MDHRAALLFGLDFHQFQAFVGDFHAFHSDFVGIGLQVRRGDLDGKTACGRPSCHRFVLFVEQPHHHVTAAVHPLVGDLVEPTVEVKVLLELASLERDVAEFSHSRHFDLVEIFAVAVPLFDGLDLHIHAGHFHETDFCAAPIHLKVETGQGIFLKCHDIVDC